MEIMNVISLAAEANVEKIPNWMVIVLGMGTVFVGLVCIVVLCKIMGMFFTRNMPATASAPKATAPASVAKSAVIENRGEIIAAVTAACAEEMGKDVSAIRVISFKKV